MKYGHFLSLTWNRVFKTRRISFKRNNLFIVPYIFFFSCEATLDNTQNVCPSVPWWLLEFSDFYSLAKAIYLNNICTIFTQHLCNICAIFAQYLHNICTKFAQYSNNFGKYLNILCTISWKIFAQNMYNISTIFVHNLDNVHIRPHLAWFYHHVAH